MAKILKFDSEAREKLLKGINTLTEAVASTLGPKGRNVAIDKKWGAPNVVHDGVTVAKEIELEDPFENMGAQLIKEAASKTNDVAGDGTTTATILAHAIVSEGMKFVAGGFDPMQLKREIEEGVDKVVESLKKMSRQVTTPEEYTQVATISAQDEEIGKKISEAIKEVGKDGVVTVEEGKTTELSVDYKEGMEFDKGYASPYFVTDADKMESSIEDPYILITDKKISAAADLVEFLNKFVPVSRNLVIIADDIEGEALALLIVNKLKGVINVLAVQAPGFGDRRKASLEDLAVLTGGTVISEETGKKLDAVEITDLGQAGRITSTKDSTLIVDGKGAKNAIEARIAQIRRELASTDSDFDKEKLQERLAKLTGGVAVINVGAATEIEMKEKKERVIDAVAATKAAIEEGIVIGGEIALYQAKEVLTEGGGFKFDPKTGLRISERKFKNSGSKILYLALQQPLRRLLKNAYGEDESFINNLMATLSGSLDEAIIGYLNERKGTTVEFEKIKFSRGHNVVTGETGDMFEMGIIDPVKVTRSALQNGASVAIMVMTTQVLITDKPEPTPPPPPMPHGGMGEY